MNLVETIPNTPSAWSKRARLGEHSWDAALWSEDGQRVRFEVALRHLNLRKGDSLLDYGCGTGALSELLPEGVKYLGVDTSPGMLNRAIREHPDREFDYRLPSHVFTHVAAIGVWNLADWKTAQTEITSLWGYCTRMLVASLHRDLVSPKQLAEAFERYGSMLRVLVDTSYRDNDSMLILRR